MPFSLVKGVSAKITSTNCAAFLVDCRVLTNFLTRARASVSFRMMQIDDAGQMRSVGLEENHRVRNVRAMVQFLLDDLRMHLVAARRDDQFLLAAQQIEIAIGIQFSDVTGRHASRSDEGAFILAGRALEIAQGQGIIAMEQ